VTSYGASTKFYQINTYDSATGVLTSLNINTNGPFNRVEGGALEVYSVSQCSQYPATTSVSFTNIEVYQPITTWNTYQQVFPAFANIVTPGLSPQCGYGVSSTSDMTTLFFHN
jgi:hypothetical protein